MAREWLTTKKTSFSTNRPSLSLDFYKITNPGRLVIFVCIKANTMNRKILKLAVPNIISNITVPLVGMVDLAIVGVMGSVDMLAAIAIGTTIFNMLYWNFGFLRMGTSGLTAQAYGGRDFRQVQRVLMRAIVVSLCIALLILLFQEPLVRAVMRFMDSSAEVESLALDYFYIRIWAAPATLALYALKGWFVGMQNSKTPMWIAIWINVVNVAASLFCAFTLDMGLSGVALGTAIAQWSGLGVAVWCVVRYYGRILDYRSLFYGVFDGRELARFFKLNSDIFIRTLCLVAVFTYFTKAGSSMGTVTLAANTLLLQLFTLFSYFMDGFAYAGESLTGRYTGSSSYVMLRRAIIAIFKAGAIVAVGFVFLYLFAGRYILMIFSPPTEVMAEAQAYIWLVAVVPLVGFGAFLMDGILVGMTRSAIMRNSMLVATVLFFSLYFSLVDSMGNMALWLAFLLYLLARSVLQIIFARKFIWGVGS